MPKQTGINGFERTSEGASQSDPRHLIEVLNGVFEKMDLNKDKVLNQDEIDRAVMDAGISPEDAEGVSVLKACFQDVKNLHKEGWFARKNGITLADLLVFEQIILTEERDAGTTAHEQLLQLVRTVLQNTNKTWHLPRTLYAGSGKAQDSIRVEAIRQGIVGDCFFLAALASVAVACPEVIPRMIKDMGDGSFTVTFPGDRDLPITVEAPTTVELALYAKSSQYGIWPAVLEKAYGVYLMNVQQKQTMIPADATHAAAHTYEAFDLLTGQTGHWEFLPTLEDEKLINILNGAFRERRAVAAGSCQSKSGVCPDGFAASHAFSIIGWNHAREEITMRNPWGRLTPEAESRVNTRDGIFAISIPTFRRNFLAIYYEDWTPDSRFDG